MQDRTFRLPRTCIMRSWVNKGKRKAGTPEESPGISWKATLPKPTPYAAMSPATIPAITTRIEHWATSLLTSGRESSSSLSLSPSFSTECLSSMSTDLMNFPSV